jgi:hypothetical protein
LIKWKSEAESRPPSTEERDVMEEGRREGSEGAEERPGAREVSTAVLIIVYRS